MSKKGSLKDYWGKRTLIIGDVGTGKTKLTVELLEEAVRKSHGEEITIIDMAPATTFVKDRKIGGKLSEHTEATKSVRYLTPEKVETPRLRAQSAEELLELVRLNEERIKPLLTRYIENPTPILFINDISIYLQQGSAEPVLSAAKKAETFIANGYYGRYFAFDYGTGVSKVEKELIDTLGERMDIVIKLEKEDKI